MIDTPEGLAASPQGQVKRRGLSLPVSAVIPQPMAELDREQLGTAANWFCVTGHLCGSQVVIRKSGDIYILSSMGFFGTRLYRRRACDDAADQHSLDASPVTGSSCLSDAESETPDCVSVDEMGPPLKRVRVESMEVEEVRDVADAPPSLLRSPVPDEPDDGVEPLILSSYEAIFLMHSVGMLRVFTTEGSISRQLALMELWELFTSRCPVFPYHYCVYLFYRGKGWIPKHALRVGADFTLYPQGPDLFHAVYSVRVQLVRSETASPRDSGLSMRDLMTLQRVTSKVDKKLVLCNVIVPERPSRGLLPSNVHLLRVKEVAVERLRPERL